MKFNNMKCGLAAVVLSLVFSVSCANGDENSRTLSNTEIVAWTKAICTQYYVPLGAKGKMVVFIEVSTSKEPWSGGDSLKLDDSFFAEISSKQVRFLREQDISSELDKINTDTHVFRATFYPFAASFQQGQKQVLVPVKNGDIQKWRQCVYKLSNEQTGWKLLSMDQQ